VGTNRYFNLFNPRSEQNLVDDLNREAIQIHGIDCVYLPRSNQKIDLVLGEDVLSKFDDVYDIEVYIKNVDGFEGQGTLMNKFGIDIKDQITLTISRTRFNDVVGTELERPREGDLIYFPLNNALLEIRYVEHESVFYNLGERYVYELKCEQYAFSHEEVKTGVDAIDEIADIAASSIFLKLGVGVGTFQQGEIVYQGLDLLEADAKATVIQAIFPAGQLQVKDIFGVFDPTNGPVKGVKSAASYSLTSLNTQAISDPLAENVPIQTESDSIIDFTENNPFSEDDF